jgi:outer membrane protein assembly factor BamB
MDRRRWYRALLGFFIAAVLGCGEQNERSTSAVPLPPTERDPAEMADVGLNWPAWRGVNTSGISTSQHLPTTWTTQQNIRWKQAVPGKGNSSPVVWGDHVLLTSGVEDSQGVQLSVYSFDRQTGTRQWKTEPVHCSGSTHSKNGYASASVTTDGNLVYAFFGSAGLTAFDLESGRQRWRKELGPLEHQWGTASSPVLVGNLVVQLCDAAVNSSIQAFDKTTGERVWNTSRDSSGSWSTPVLVEATDAAGQKRRELVVNGTGVDGGDGGAVIAYDPATGQELWRVVGTTEVVCPSAIVGDDLVISTSGRSGPIIAIRPGGDGDVTHSNVVWKHSKGGPYVPTGIAYRNRLYTIADGGILSCYNLGNGDEIWRDRLRGTFSASLIAGNGNLYATSEYGVVYVVAASDTFQPPIAANDMQERMMATPAAAGDDLFLRTETQLYCVSGMKPRSEQPLAAGR